MLQMFNNCLPRVMSAIGSMWSSNKTFYTSFGTSCCHRLNRNDRVTIQFDFLDRLKMGDSPKLGELAQS